MAYTQQTFTFGGVNSGGYDSHGTYFPSSTDAVTNSGFIGENVFYAFSATAIAQATAGLINPPSPWTAL